MAEPFEKKTYYAITLDPVHIGTGGYRLGRVDNTITREPGTNIPKIPGSSLAGAARAYTALAIQSEHPTDPKKMKYQRPGKEIVMKKEDGTEEKKIIYYSCAGKGVDDGEGHCGEPDCPVCVAFGFSKGKSGSSFQGLTQFYDARILFFPVHSMIGPVWITSPSVIGNFMDAPPTIHDENFRAINSTYKAIKRSENDQLAELNFGWLMLKPDSVNFGRIDIDFSTFLNSHPNSHPNSQRFCQVCQLIMNRAFLVSDKLFSRLVNDNLEVRTSVAIDPATGAAEEGALYTYEAIPRATVMWFEVIYNDPAYFKIKNTGNIYKPIALESPGSYADPLGRRSEKEDSIAEKDDQIGRMAFYLEKGLKYLKDLGVGGMNTRGMGRIEIVNVGGQG